MKLAVLGISKSTFNRVGVLLPRFTASSLTGAPIVNYTALRIGYHLSPEVVIGLAGGQSDFALKYFSNPDPLTTGDDDAICQRGIRSGLYSVRFFPDFRIYSAGDDGTWRYDNRFAFRSAGRVCVFHQPVCLCRYRRTGVGIILSSRRRDIRKPEIGISFGLGTEF